MNWDDPEKNRQLLAKLSGDAGFAMRYPEYVAYLALMGGGTSRKNEAIHKVMRPWTRQLSEDPLGEKLGLLHTICSNLIETGESLRSHPRLGIPAELQAVFDATIGEALENEPNDYRAHLWSAAVASDSDERVRNLDTALKLAPSSPLAAKVGAELSLSWAEYALHHVPDGLLAEPADIEADIDRAESCAALLSADQAQRVIDASALHRERLAAYLKRQRHAL